MGILNYTTKKTPETTSGEIQGMLARRGVTRVSTTYSEDGAATGLTFVLRTDYGMREFALPIRFEGTLAAMNADPSIPKSFKNPEQAMRTAWRIALVWLEGQLALIDAQLVTLDEVMMPFMVDSHGNTAYAVMRESALKELER